MNSVLFDRIILNVNAKFGRYIPAVFHRYLTCICITSLYIQFN